MGRKTLIDAQIDRIRSLRRSGFSYSMISTKLGISRTTACKYSQDIMLRGQPKRFRSDSMDIILTKIKTILTELLDANVIPDDVDLVLKQCRAKLDRFDTDTVVILQDNAKGHFNFIRKVLDELNFTEKYGLTIRIPTNKPQDASDSTEQHKEIDNGTACDNQ